MRWFVRLKYILFGLLAALPAMAAATAPCTPATFAALGLDNTILLKVESLPAGANPSPVGTIATPICRVYAVFDQRTVGGAVLGDFFEVWLPSATWNGKYQGAGNGGLAGSITYSDMRAAVARGYATSSTDTGHSSNAASNPWWTDAPAIKDYGYRAIHETALRSKAIIQAFYGSAPSHSYFNACSTGGREAFMEAQRYPTDYDGIIAGSPVYRVIKLRARHVHTWQCNYLDTSNAHAIPVAKLRPIYDAIVAQCDGIDGLVDGQVDDPRRCNFDPASIQCAGADNVNCLTAAQVETFRCIYRGATDPDTGAVIYPGPPLTSELDEAQNIGQAPNTQYTTFFANTVFENPAYDFLTFRFPGDVTFSLNNRCTAARRWSSSTTPRARTSEPSFRAAASSLSGTAGRTRCPRPATPSRTTRAWTSSSSRTTMARTTRASMISRGYSCCRTSVTAAAARPGARTPSTRSRRWSSGWSTAWRRTR